MPDPKENEEKVDETTAQNGTEENKEQKTDEEQIDYDKEFKEALESFETKEKNREGFNQRKANENNEATNPDLQTLVAEGVKEALKTAIPQIKAELTEDSVDTLLEEFSGGDANKKKLLRFHFINSVGSNGTLRERMENALLITDKKTILKTQQEMAVALHNRQGISNTGQGASTEGQEVQDNFFSKEQLAELKKRGYDDAKIERLKTNMRNRH